MPLAKPVAPKTDHSPPCGVSHSLRIAFEKPILSAPPISPQSSKVTPMTLSHNPQNPSPRRLTRLLKWLIRWRRECLLLAIVLGGSGAYVGRELKMDRSLQSMFASTDPLIGVYQDLQTAFGQHDIVLAIYGEQELSSSDGLARVATLSESARQIPGIAAVVSLVRRPSSVMIRAGAASSLKSNDNCPSRSASNALTRLRNDAPCANSSLACLMMATSWKAKNVSAGVRVTGRSTPHFTR